MHASHTNVKLGLEYLTPKAKEKLQLVKDFVNARWEAINSSMATSRELYNLMRGTTTFSVSVNTPGAPPYLSQGEAFRESFCYFPFLLSRVIHLNRPYVPEKLKSTMRSTGKRNLRKKGHGTQTVIDSINKQGYYHNFATFYFPSEHGTEIFTPRLIIALENKGISMERIAHMTKSTVSDLEKFLLEYAMYYSESQADDSSDFLSSDSHDERNQPRPSRLAYQNLIDQLIELSG